MVLSDSARRRLTRIVQQEADRATLRATAVTADPAVRSSDQEADSRKALLGIAAHAVGESGTVEQLNR